jgi:hypothetical protein
MIFFSIGLPSRFAEWCDLIARLLVETVKGEADLISANTLDELGLAAIRSHSDHLVVASRQPAEDLRRSLIELQYPFIVALDAPYIALDNLIGGHGVDVIGATRATANSCAAMMEYAVTSGACLLYATEQSENPLSVAAAIAKCFGLGLNPKDLAQIVASVPEIAAPEPVSTGGRRSDRFETPHGDVAAGALAGYADHFFGGGQLGPLKWRRELFYLGDDPSRAADEAISVAGPVRNLLFGPYIVLPFGHWGAIVNLAISKDAVGTELGIEVVAGPQCIRLAYATAAPGREGINRVALAFTVDQTTEQPICLRVAILQPRSRGLLALVDVGLSTQTIAEVTIPVELATALGL